MTDSDARYVDRTEAMNRLAASIDRLATGLEIALPVLTDLSMPKRPEAPRPAVYQPPAQEAPFVPAAPYVAPVAAPVALGGLTVGSIHIQGHKPLKQNARGLFCPTKLADGSWCQFHTA